MAAFFAALLVAVVAARLVADAGALLLAVLVAPPVAVPAVPVVMVRAVVPLAEAGACERSAACDVHAPVRPAAANESVSTGIGKATRILFERCFGACCDVM
ncbi:hypothetical protein WN71_024205 [Streptomyces mangrovisoli]|uniref:Uncharacterized protein n=1 Tax=Streptomyces mangrovisoli TaxID=1428628 RepID=A0A1J4NVX3_9ACTN|nr:hypothetical protein WN71_024205 [Streptomyces mangrovisoli]